MRIIVAGAWQWPWYEQACAEALRSLEHEVKRFSWDERFERFVPDQVEPIPLSRAAAWQNRAIWGPTVFAVNWDLFKAVKRFQPQILLAYRATHVFPSTLRAINRASPGTLLVQYCNDDPFSPNASKVKWRHLLRSIPIYDIHFVYRPHNIADFKNAGARHVKLLRSYYIPERNYPVQLKEGDSRFVCDVVFAGHYENDLRVGCLEAAMQNGFKLNLFGGGWAGAEPHLSPASPLRRLYPIAPVVDEEYRKALSGARIALCFLSKLNRDTYTRRNFEIPAMGSFMLSEYSADLATLFEEGREAEFFRSKEELIDKVKYYLAHDTERESIARRGRERLLRDGHGVLSRMRQMLDQIRELVGVSNE